MVNSPYRAKLILKHGGCILTLHEIKMTYYLVVDYFSPIFRRKSDTKFPLPSQPKMPKHTRPQPEKNSLPLVKKTISWYEPIHKMTNKKTCKRRFFYQKNQTIAISTYVHILLLISDLRKLIFLQPSPPHLNEHYGYQLI